MVKIPLNNYEKIICRLIQLCCLGMTIPELGTYIYMYIYSYIIDYMNICILYCIPVVPHKAVAEVSE